MSVNKCLSTGERARLLSSAAALAATLWAGSASGGELLVGVGFDDPFGDEGAAAALVEARSGALADIAGLALHLGAAGEVDGDGDLWLGAGVVALYPLGADLRLEASFMPGYYDAGSGNDLGGGLQFRTEAGVSLAVSASLRIGVALSHKSNAGTRSANPGVETVSVRAIYAF